MKLLIDTHCWLWWLSAPDKINRRAQRLVANRDHEVFLSAASCWEMAIKVALGKLRIEEPLHLFVPSRLAAQGMQQLAVTHAHALRVALLPHHHRDPFDRMLVAQAQLEGLTILTADRQLEPYDVDTVWAD